MQLVPGLSCWFVPWPPEGFLQEATCARTTCPPTALMRQVPWALWFSRQLPQAWLLLWVPQLSLLR